MRLYVDIGNTAIKWANEVELQTGVLHQVSSGGLPAAIEGAWLKIQKPDEVHIASVLQHQVLLNLVDWIQRHWQIAPMFAQTKQDELGVINGYRQPSQLGVDRWLVLLAARMHSLDPLIIVDCGSATTVDAMDADGRHLGGIILPGLKLFASCLRQNTDIPPYGAGEIMNCFATDTAAGVNTGAMLAHTATIEKLYQNLQLRCGGEIGCLVTGGGAELLSRHLELAHDLVPDLVLQGLAHQSAHAQ
ncbi:MAG: type III pantothenate kinase [Candidatus Thiodiazotropha sp. (ex Lucinoma borealis)]|nr:type III pantothenate kinase [Candidatus Thiodiazotropha sp. (ex Lucinoma borealis)]